MVLLPVQVDALGVGDVLLLGVSEQTAGGDRGAKRLRAGGSQPQRGHNLIGPMKVIRLDADWPVSLKSISRT